jgi:hypothetical protein
MHDEVFTASNLDAGIRFNWSRRLSDQRESFVPWKYQSDPLSARIIP